MQHIKKIVEELLRPQNEEELIDDFSDIQISDDDVVQDEPVTEVPQQPETSELYSDTDKLEALTKISRALDVLGEAIDEFEVSIIDVLDITGQADLISTIDELKNKFQQARDIVSPNKSTEQSPIDLSFGGELEDEEPEQELDDVELSDEEIEPTEGDEDEEDKEVDFDKEASLFNFDEV